MKAAKYALNVYAMVGGDIGKFIKELMGMGKSFEIAEKQYYACKKLSYNRYA